MNDNIIVKHSILDLHTNILSFLENSEEISEEKLFALEDSLDLIAIALPETIYNTAVNFIETHLEPLVYRENNDGNIYQKDYLSAKSIWKKIVQSDLRPIIVTG